MTVFKHIAYFTKNNILYLKRKGFALPLVFISPIIIIGLMMWIIITMISPTEDDPIELGIVDLDKSPETELVYTLIEEYSKLGDYIQIERLSEEAAKSHIDANNLTAYILFPKNFTNDLYQGNPVELAIIGNKNQRLESMLIHEIIESVARHIRASQANILTMNHYAKEMNMDDEERRNFVFEQFKEFLFYTLGSNQILKEKELNNQVTSSPIHYYVLSSWFILVTIWGFLIYHLFTKETSLSLIERMRLYGVTLLQQIIAKIIVTVFTVLFFAIIYLFFIEFLLGFDLIIEDYVRIIIIQFLYVISLSFVFGSIEILISSLKGQLFLQMLGTIIIVFSSGAIIPIIYLPTWLEQVFQYSFSYESFYWLREVMLNNRLYVDFIPLSILTAVSLFVFIGLATWKERVLK